MKSLKVKDSTLVKYHESVVKFEQFCKRRKLCLKTWQDADNSFTEYFADLLEQQQASTVASYALFGYLLLRTNEHTPDKLLYPKARQCLKGWNVRYPQSSRTGADPQIWFLLADNIGLTHPWYSAAILLQLDTYARPSEILKLKKRDVFRPTSRHLRFWGVIFGNSEHGESTKTQTMDDTVLLDSSDRQFAPKVMACLFNKASSPDDLLFPHTSLGEYEAVLRAAKTAVGLGRFDFTPHAIRHSGPSVDSLTHARNPSEIQARGRWKTLKSVQRYQKPGQMQAKMNRIPTHVWKKAAVALPQVLQKIFRHYGSASK